MQKEATITSHDNEEFMAYVAQPDTDQAVPAIIVIQEIFGVNEVMRDICDQLAQTGYIAICPDLFWRQEPGIQITDKTEEEWARAFELFQRFDTDLGIEDLKSTLAFARQLENCTGKVGSIGYCLGGKLAYLMATRAEADCNVSYYGVSIDEHLNEADEINAPLLMHIAEKDEYVPLEAQKKILEQLNDIPFVDANVYPGVNHAFARKGGAHFDKQAADLANHRTADFLATCLGKEDS